jgi:hypothetical protein
MSATQAPSAEFIDAGKPVAQPFYLVGSNGVIISADGLNRLQTVQVAVQGYVTPYSGNASATTATTDYSFAWGSGSTQVFHVMLQNTTGSNIQWELDTAANAGSPVLATGQTLFLDVQCTTLHLYTAAIQNVNGTSANNIVVRAWI